MGEKFNIDKNLHYFKAIIEFFILKVMQSIKNKF